MAIVNNELLRLAQKRFAKSAAVPAGATDPAAMAAADPAMAAGGDPMAAVTAAPMDMAMGGGGQMAPVPTPPPPPAPAPAPQASGSGGQQKLKPEQMMQMIDYRMYNMQQQLTAIMNALGVQLPPEAIVLPPGSTSAPPAEAALPGGPGAPQPAAAPAPAGDPAAAAGGLPQDVYAGEDPAQTGGVVPPIPPNKAAWWQDDEPKAASYIGDPVARNEEKPLDLQESAAAAAALYRSLMRNAR